ncbi:Gfo/Idh/MocA family oxidoreductase [Ectopseudomonas mendocina]|uniref:Gfo/Idh/MocA-like oxidoreductase N-terminal domain-containing protein n=1 Tax=Ectopseudomonas mendocina S5.2 TaxID=1225174 RepID=A0ABN4IXZ1_ECTME|nr:Gfo/Idh/MocA family oxidoreductase [Pseudomonas mendocina]ALN19716.1 hypothetical protein DW68_014090 [Pseudomonas mendocina S5.2]KER99401.1 hypothetical protein HN51_06030 [Pseudomonas mendocina]
MKSVLLVGAGNLGRRHLQSLKACQLPIRIFVVEPYEEARSLAESAYQATESNAPEKEIGFYSDLGQIDQQIDIAVVSTPASGRLEILRDVLALGAKDVVLEKVAFNSVAAIDEASALVEQYQARAWVNCPRRLNPFYQQLRRALEDDPIESFEVEGGNFGMACNAIHFLDLCAFLSRQSSYQITLAGVREVVPSKRSNYIEFFGEVAGSFESGPAFKIACHESGHGVSFTIKLVTQSAQYLIDEVNGTVEIIDAKGDRQQQGFRQPYQSELTGPLIDEIIQQQRCGLTNFTESMSLHRPFIDAAYRLYAEKYEENSLKMVPIT